MERQRPNADRRRIETTVYGYLIVADPLKRDGRAIHFDADLVPGMMVVVQRQNHGVFDHDGIPTMKVAA
jgi:hypothetical protein